MTPDNNTEVPTVPRQLPVVEPETAAFWTGGADGRLHICRCGACGTWVHPPQPRCPTCRGADIVAQPVSGRGRVATYTINEQVWTKALTEPFVFAAVELEEQAELYVLTNIVGCPVDAVFTGMAVEVEFEQREEIFLPLFRPREDAR